MKTITLQIGNTDHKLSQAYWATFVKDINYAIDNSGVQVHFFGGADNSAPYCNRCWVFESDDDDIIKWIKLRVTTIRKKYNQDSVAWTEGQTQLI